MLDTTLQYDIGAPTMIRFLGENHTGEYRNSKSTINVLKKSKCNKKYKRLTESFRERLSKHNECIFITYQNSIFFRYTNHSSIDKNIEKVLKAINKEDRNQYHISLPNWLARFIRHLHVTPQGLIIKDGENDRLIRDGLSISHWLSMCINMMLSQDT